MLYPVYVHPGDERHAHGVTFPDFPGCFSAADDWADLPRLIQEAVEVYFEGEAGEVPPPTPLEVLAREEITPSEAGAAAFAQKVQRDHRQWGEVIRATGFTLEQ